MYRNCIYSNKTKSIHLWTWDASGNRVHQEVEHLPYIYLEDRGGSDKSIFGSSVKKKVFKDEFHRKKFLKDSGIRRIFENLPPYQQFLVDNYYHNNESPEFSSNPLKVCFLDIENPKKTGEGFPDLETADTVINLITCYDSLTKRYTTFGLKSYSKKRDDLDYYHCKSEEDLLKRFIGYISSDFPDVISGYNSNGYDIKYLINRITLILGKEWADELSPTGNIYEKQVIDTKTKQQKMVYVIEGISCLDYMELYLKFKLSDKPENFKLDTVGEHELKRNKIHYEGSLWDLSVDNWDTYVDYNILDVQLVVELDDKLAYISLIRFLAYTGLCGFEQAMKTVGVINGAIASKARLRGQYIPSFTKPKKEGKNPGGFVQESKEGFAENVVSFDANSLYPSVMISLNISPETKIGSLHEEDDKILIRHVSGKSFEFTPESFSKYIKTDKIAVSASNHLYSQSRKGLMPEFLDGLYTKRKDMKSRMLSLKSKLSKFKGKLSIDQIKRIEFEIQKCDTYQNAYKICLNSVYGYTGNQFAFMGDDDIATSVTLTGQSINKRSRLLFVEHLVNSYGVSETDAEGGCIAGDTDSVYFSLKCLQSRIPLKEGGDISTKFMDLCDDIENHINSSITKYCIDMFNTIDCRIVYKREGISDSGIFLAKKHYILHVLNDEGNKVDKFKYAGVAVVTGKMPKVLKPYIKKITEHMILSRSLSETNKLFSEAYEVFKNLPVENISSIYNLNNHEKYSKLCTGLNLVKGITFVPKASYRYDYMLKELKIDDKYTPFQSGERIRIVNLKLPNRYNIDAIGFKDKLPNEFYDIFSVDYEKMFDKMVFKPIESLYDAVNWKLRKPNHNVRVELEDLFS